MLETTALTLGYHGEAVARFPALSLKEGESCLLIGPSGCGKTTLLHTLAGFILPLEGTVSLDGETLSGMDESARDRLRGRKIGLIFQTLHLMPALTVEQNLRLAAYAAGLPYAAEQGSAALRTLGIVEKKQSRPDSLSQGQRQRVAIARTLVNRPSLILADEPTSSLDDASCEAVAGLIRRMVAETNAALLISTHDGRLRPHFERVIEMGQL